MKNVDHIIHHAEEYCRNHGIRLTIKRKHVLTRLIQAEKALSAYELMDACQERGMRSVDINEYGYKLQLKEWLDLSIQKNIPIALLIMSRAFMLKNSRERFSTATTSISSIHPHLPHTTERVEDVIIESMSSLDNETINEIVLASTSDQEALKNPEENKIRKLESLEYVFCARRPSVLFIISLFISCLTDSTVTIQY